MMALYPRASHKAPSVSIAHIRMRHNDIVVLRDVDLENKKVQATVASTVAFCVFGTKGRPPIVLGQMSGIYVKAAEAKNVGVIREKFIKLFTLQAAVVALRDELRAAHLRAGGILTTMDIKVRDLLLAATEDDAVTRFVMGKERGVIDSSFVSLVPGTGMRMPVGGWTAAGLFEVALVEANTHPIVLVDCKGLAYPQIQQFKNLCNSGANRDKRIHAVLPSDAGLTSKELAEEHKMVVGLALEVQDNHDLFTLQPNALEAVSAIQTKLQAYIDIRPKKKEQEQKDE